MYIYLLEFPQAQSLGISCSPSPLKVRLWLLSLFPGSLFRLISVFLYSSYTRAYGNGTARLSTHQELFPTSQPPFGKKREKAEIHNQAFLLSSAFYVLLQLAQSFELIHPKNGKNYSNLYNCDILQWNDLLSVVTTFKSMELLPKIRFFKSRQLCVPTIIHYFENSKEAFGVIFFFPIECYFWALVNIQLSAIKKRLDSSEKNTTVSKKSY